MGKIYYRIAQLDIKLELKNLNPIYLFNFTPFRVEDESVSTLLFSITQGKIKEIRCNPTREYIVDQFIISIYLLKNECYLKVHSGLTKKNYFFQTDYQWSDIKTDLLFNELEEYAVLNHVITFFFIYSSSFYDTVFFNASSICFGTDAVAFLGEKGVGKSTHADLWVNHIEGSKLLNDDQPAIRIINNTIYIYGTPWGGKKSCYKNESANLISLFIMEPFKENEITLLSAFTAFCKLLSICSIMHEEKETFNCIVRTLVNIAEAIPIYLLKNKPEPAAAFLAYSFCYQSVV